MLRALEKKLSHHHLLRPQDSVLLAVSGGVDSMVLLHLMDRLGKKWRLNLAVAHVNHRLRGRASDAEEELVKRSAKKLGHPIYITRWKKPARGNMQNAARKFRYEWFKKAAKKMGGGLIATAHHRDDQAETVLLQLIRGTGLKGLGGIAWCTKFQGLDVIHPLLDLGRDEIEAYAARHKVPFAQDQSNRKLDYRRNLVRLKVMPLLESINPRIKESIADVADALQTNYQAMATVAHSFAAQYFTAQDNKVTWNREAFVKLPTALRREVLMEAFEDVTGDRVDLNSDQIRRMEEISLSGKTSGSYMLPQRLKFCRLKDLLSIQSINA